MTSVASTTLYPPLFDTRNDHRLGEGPDPADGISVSSNQAVPNGAEKPTRQPVISSQPLVSNAVSATLLHLQETGSIFNEKDASLMNIRGVTDSDRQRFAEIVQDAAATGGYQDPVGYIQSLSNKDVQVLRRVHSLAETSGVLNTNVEGAVNLLLPPQNHTDLNNDGLVNTGAAVGFVFPPPNAPQSVKDAWEETIKDLPENEKLLATTPFMVASVAANIKFDSEGTAIGIYEHTDPEYRNVFGNTEDEWDALLKGLIEQRKGSDLTDPRQKEMTELLEKFAAAFADTREVSV